METSGERRLRWEDETGVCPFDGVTQDHGGSAKEGQGKGRGGWVSKEDQRDVRNL